MRFSAHLRRRAWLSGAAALAAGLLPLATSAQSAWPGQRPIKIIDVSAPGGSGDVMARMLASKLSQRLGQAIVVENKTGAGGSLGTDAVARAAPDGYTLLMDNSAIATNSASGKKLPYDPVKDFVRIGQIAVTPLLVAVPADSPIKTLGDLVRLARAKPNDGVRYGSSGVGSMSHIGMALLGSVADVQMMHVPYKGLPLSIADLLGGQLQATLTSYATNQGLLESGKLRAIVASSASRSPFLPQVPTSVEAGFPEFQIEYWWGLTGPAGLPPAIVQRLNRELNAVLAEPEVQAFLARAAALPAPGTPEHFERINASEVRRWSKLIRDAGIVIE